MSATACLTSSTLKGLMTAVISFMHLSPHSSVNQSASGVASRTIDLDIADSVPAPAVDESTGYVQRCPRVAPKCRSGRTKTRNAMSFINAESLDELARKLADSVPESVRAFGRDLEGNFKAVLQAQLARLDLVTRQEFDVQSAILQRTQSKLTELEARLKDLESKLAAH